MNPKILYHGTATKNLVSIAKNGLRPRGGSNNDNWKHTVSSNPNAVYLTSVYPVHFAYAASRPGSGIAIIEIDAEAVAANLHADEDAIEQMTRKHGDDLPKEWDLKQRTLHYRGIADKFGAPYSLSTLGTCGHRGVIDPKHFRRVVTVSGESEVFEVVLLNDATITLANYRYCGEHYKRLGPWLFGDLPDGLPSQHGGPNHTSRAGIRVFDNIGEVFKIKKGER